MVELEKLDFAKGAKKTAIGLGLNVFHTILNRQHLFQNANRRNTNKIKPGILVISEMSGVLCQMCKQ